MIKSNPNTFSGTELSADKFCFNIQHSPDYNAFAQPFSREITFATETIKTATSLDSIAMIMGHELAHISMKHQINRHPAYVPSDSFRNIDSQLQNQMAVFGEISSLGMQFEDTAFKTISCAQRNGMDPRNAGMQIRNLSQQMICAKTLELGVPFCAGYTSSNGSFESVKLKMSLTLPKNCSVIIDKIPALVEKLSSLQTQIDEDLVRKAQMAIKAELIKSPAISREEASNWREREADEIGYELFIRAGFDKQKAQETLVRLAYMNIGYLRPGEQNPVKKCLSEIEITSTAEEIREKLHNYERGENMHPNGCWRLLHHIYERRVHKNDIATTPTSSVQANLNQLWINAKNEIARTPYRQNQGN